MHFKQKVLKFILTHTILVLVTVGLGHAVYRKLYTLIWGQRAEKFENHCFKQKGTSWKTALDDFVDEFDSRHDKRRIKLRWGDDDIKFERSLCENDIAHCLFVWIFFGLEVVHDSRIGRHSQINTGLKSQLLRISQRKIQSEK